MAEGKQTVGSVNRAQQAYRIENSTFASDFDQLEIGLPTATENYTYTIAATAGESATVIATTEETPLKEFSGGVFVTNQGLTSTAACQTKAVNENAAVPALSGDEATCPASMEPMR